MENFFVVLGGMGTMATESFIHLLNQRTPANKDQDYLNYIVCNHASIPDRTAFILQQSKEDPYPVLQEDIISLQPLHPRFFVLTCNTAHYFYERLQESSIVPILHMPRIAAHVVAKKAQGEKKRVMILATSGTIQSKVYHQELESYPNLEICIPDAELQKEVMGLIYDDIKEKDWMNEARYHQILQRAKEEYHCDYMILGCTELSLIEEKCPNHPYEVIDAQSELVNQVLVEMKKK